MTTHIVVDVLIHSRLVVDGRECQQDGVAMEGTLHAQEGFVTTLKSSQ